MNEKSVNVIIVLIIMMLILFDLFFFMYLGNSQNEINENSITEQIKQLKSEFTYEDTCLSNNNQFSELIQSKYENFLLFFKDNAQKEDLWQLNLPHTWLPSEGADLQTVACITEKFEVVQRCDYRDPNGQASTVTRFRHEIDLIFRIFPSGEIIDQFEMSGGSPRNCQQQEAISLSNIYGTLVTVFQIKSRLGLFLD